MNLQSLVVVILRLVSLDFILQVTIRLAPQILRFTDMSLRGSPGGLETMLALPWLMLTGLIGGAVVFWMFAEPIARMVTHGLLSEVSLGTLSLADGYSILFIGVGLCYIASHFSLVLNWTQYMLRTAGSYSGIAGNGDTRLYDILNAFIPFIIGIVLFVNGRKWAIALARRHVESDQPIQPPPENVS